MTEMSRFRWRKTTDINRNYSIFEMLADDIILVDVGFSDDGVMQVAFHEGIVGKVFEWAQLQESFQEGIRLAEKDR